MQHAPNFYIEKNLEAAVRLFKAQSVLFAPHVSRLALQELDIDRVKTQQLTVNVWRNHSFEPLESLVAPYFAYRGLGVDFRLGCYDDTLMFAGHQEAALELIWFDSTRFLVTTSFADLLQWLEERLRILRATTMAPILLATWVEGCKGTEAIQILADSLPAVYFGNLEAICTEAGVPLLDSRSARLAGTPLSSVAQVILARELACHWLSGILLPPVKALALDLDNTLHAGVLGEDGIQGVQLTPAHTDLQDYIKFLRQRGIFIALVSRNQWSDVEALFAQRQDYPLRLNDFSVIEVSWNDKGAAVERIAKALRIDPDAVLFVDDNLGELISVAMQLPQVHTIYAYSDARLTQQAISFYPGLWRWQVDSDDTKRIQDLKVNSERESLAKSITDSAEYFRSLQATLTYSYDSKERLTRLTDLCNKTNQFNLALRRFNQAEIAARMMCNDACVASVQLTDRLSDSGIIAVIIAKRQGEQLLVEDLCISCRAMGRQMEDTIIFSALRDMPIIIDCLDAAFQVQHGPRNQPALDWLARQLGLDEPPAPGIHILPISQILNYVPAAGVTLIKE
jgi:FkbH-like protein